jgi:chromate reductase, NAD(P)H dehydrogenase (quinone)
MIPVQIVGVSGSLRAKSYNRALLVAAQELLPPDVSMEIAELHGIPPYNMDLEDPAPPAVLSFKGQIRKADAVLFAVPEYNYSVAGILKNAIDWASRPYQDNVWAGKPVAMVSASIGMLGGARAQYDLRRSFVFLDMHPINRPEVFVSFAPTKFDEQLRLKDEPTRKVLRQLLSALVDLTRRLRPPAPK